MALFDPYERRRRYFECRNCGGRETSDDRLTECPDCGGRVKNIAVARE